MPTPSRRSVEMKAEIVAEDEREAGRRALLNLGHTFAHALEAETGFGEALKHGEAVGIGCALAFRFSAQLGLCSGPGRRARRRAPSPPPACRRSLAELAGAPVPRRRAGRAHGPGQEGRGRRADLHPGARRSARRSSPRASTPAAARDFLIGEGAVRMSSPPRSSPPRRSSWRCWPSRRCSPPPRPRSPGASRGRMHQLERDGDRAAGPRQPADLRPGDHDRRGADRLQRAEYPELRARDRCSSPRSCRAPGASPSPPA